MKRFLAVLLVVVAAATLLCACEPTPDQVLEENKVTLDTVDWKFAVEGGSMDTYTLADAQKHELAKMTTSDMFDQSDANAIYTSVTFVVQGITLKDFLADIGKPDATEITYSGKNSLGEAISYTIKAEDFADQEKVIIGWIMNKTAVLTASESYVGMFFDGRSTLKPVLSLEKVVVK